MSKVVEFKRHHSTTPDIENRKILPTPPKYSQVREREYLTTSEIERISKAAKSIIYLSYSAMDKTNLN
ncbi:hypothetical protein [Shewanella metallivivens]|uniref:Uncharacterized protein n=1 Tax=Shewanella metallivivens TaxID=2872342 RepID=A0ABT5TIE8_9GAMM|nr:hypothetical protein [Shewanella metallivivens]MDD8058232.1 hypothetical protein [Shewanella metallivivens]